MNFNYWNLFWTTGMPEAWLMSREGPPPSGAARENEAVRAVLSGPLAPGQPHLSDNSPGGPEKLY